jgi:arylformamidase
MKPFERRSRDRKFYDISQTLSEGIAAWPGDPEYRSGWVMRIADGDSSNVSVLNVGAHTGTHIDAPLHLFNSGADAASIPINSCVGRVRVFSLASEKRITVADLLSLDWHGMQRVLFKTRSGNAPESQFEPDFVSIDESAAEFLVKNKIVLVGTDAPSVDPFESKDLSSHKILLRSGIGILEGARLREVPEGDYHLICLPLKLSGLDGSPVRAVLYD